MKEVIEYIFKDMVIPILVALVTLYYGTKWKSSQDVKKENAEANLQAEKFYLKLVKLNKSIEDYLEHKNLVQEMSDDYHSIQSGKVKYSPDDYEGMNEQDYLLGQFDTIEDLKKFTITKDITDIRLHYSQLRVCSIDKIKDSIRFSCLKVMEIGENPKTLIQEIEFLKELEDKMEPKY